MLWCFWGWWWHDIAPKLCWASGRERFRNGFPSFYVPKLIFCWISGVPLASVGTASSLDAVSVCTGLTPWGVGLWLSSFLQGLYSELVWSWVREVSRFAPGKGNRGAVKGSVRTPMFDYNWRLWNCSLGVCLYWQTLTLGKSPLATNLSFTEFINPLFHIWSCCPLALLYSPFFTLSLDCAGLQMPLTCPVLPRCAQKMTSSLFIRIYHWHRESDGGHTAASSFVLHSSH